MFRHFSFIVVSACLLSDTARAKENTGSLRPVNLRCEYARDPLGVDAPHPRLFWQLDAAGRGRRQTAYRILAASSTNLLDADAPDLWDSGRIRSDESIQIHYQGKPLKSSQAVFWKVRVWDETRSPSAWSETARWTMGVLEEGDWRAVWICAPADTETLLLRKEFEVKPGLVRALAHVCGLGQYEMVLNGAKAGEDLLSPGWTDYTNTALYDSREITGLLRPGRNTVGLTLGNGMYHVTRRNRFAKFTGSFGPLRAIAQIRLEYADGSVQIVGTDETWRVLAGPIVFSSIYGGEDYDARLNPSGWDQPGFDDKTWQAAVSVARPSGKLRGQSLAAEPLRAIEVRKPVSMHPLESPGEAVYDLGQNASYMPRLRVSGPAGGTVRLIPAEILNPDGRIQRSTMGNTNRGISWWQYTKATDGEETWFPQFYYVGCRYLQAVCRPPALDRNADLRSAVSQASRPPAQPKIESLEGVIVHSSAAPVGQFACANPRLNRIRELVRWAQRSNMVSILTDCPHREKLGWIEQYHLNGPAIRYEYDTARIFAKGMGDMADAQLDSGLVPNIAPEYTQFKGAFRSAAEWGAAFILVPWQQYQFCGDVDLLRLHYPQMKRYFGYLESLATNDILAQGLGDWFDLGPHKPGAAQLTPPPVTATAFFFYDAWLLSQIARRLDQPAEAAAYAARAERIRTNYNANFFDPARESYATGSQCANALPLVLDIVEPAHRPGVLKALLRDLESRDYAVSAGDIGFRFVLQALAREGQSEAIYRMINQDDKPGYGYQLKLGATSLTESWDANKTTSHNHFMLGQITEWFYKDLAGIDTDPAGPGFKKILIHPQPVGDLTWVRASYDSIRGAITSEWRRENGKFTLDVTIPANTTATVFLPANPGDAVTENGVPAKKSAGVKFLRREGNRAIYKVASGKYRFESQFLSIPSR